LRAAYANRRRCAGAFATGLTSAIFGHEASRSKGGEAMSSCQNEYEPAKKPRPCSDTTANGGTAIPIHDGTRVRANRFHHFHQTWTANLAAALNSGRLPPGFLALAEQITGGPEAEVVALELTPPTGTSSSPGMSVAVAPPAASFVMHSEAANYARKADPISIRHPDGDVVAMIESLQLPKGQETDSKKDNCKVK
jgi:hypothetical protein